MTIDIMESTDRYTFENVQGELRLIFWDNMEEQNITIWPHEGLEELMAFILKGEREMGKRLGRSKLQNQIKDLLNIKS
jgi:hypothetical protein